MLEDLSAYILALNAKRAGAKSNFWHRPVDRQIVRLEVEQRVNILGREYLEGRVKGIGKISGIPICVVLLLQDNDCHVRLLYLTYMAIGMTRSVSCRIVRL